MTSLFWHGKDLGILDIETDPREMAERMVELDKAQVVYDTIVFFEHNYADDIGTFIEMAITGRFDGLELTDFVEDMMQDVLENIDNYGAEYVGLEDLGLEVVEE